MDTKVVLKKNFVENNCGHQHFRKVDDVQNNGYVFMCECCGKKFTKKEKDNIEKTRSRGDGYSYDELKLKSAIMVEHKVYKNSKQYKISQMKNLHIQCRESIASLEDGIHECDAIAELFFIPLKANDDISDKKDQQSFGMVNIRIYFKKKEKEYNLTKIVITDDLNLTNIQQSNE